MGRVLLLLYLHYAHNLIHVLQYIAPKIQMLYINSQYTSQNNKAPILSCGNIFKLCKLHCIRFYHNLAVFIANCNF